MKWLIMVVAVAMPAMAQVSGSGENRTYTVHSSQGTACTINAPGTYAISKEGIASMVEACNRRDRGKAILAITGPTNRDVSRMTPAQVQALRCQNIRDKIEVQLDLQAAGSSGYYNLSMLRVAERQQCGSNKEK